MNMVGWYVQVILVFKFALAQFIIFNIISELLGHRLIIG